MVKELLAKFWLSSTKFHEELDLQEVDSLMYVAPLTPLALSVLRCLSEQLRANHQMSSMHLHDGLPQVLFGMLPLHLTKVAPSSLLLAPAPAPAACQGLAWKLLHHNCTASHICIQSLGKQSNVKCNT